MIFEPSGGNAVGPEGVEGISCHAGCFLAVVSGSWKVVTVKSLEKEGWGSS